MPFGHTFSLHQLWFLEPDSHRSKEEEEEEAERRWHGGQTPRGTSLAAQGMLGQAGTWWALNHGCLRGRAGSPPREEGLVMSQAPFSIHPFRPTKLPSFLLHYFIFIPALTAPEMTLFVFACSLSVPPTRVSSLQQRLSCSPL